MPVDNVYQTGNNLKVSNSRVLSHDCFEKEFDSHQLGGSSITLVVPSNALFSDAMVYLKWTGTIAQGYYLPPAWGYKAIRDITYIWGGSEQLKITGEANFLRAMNESENDRKKTAILQLGGALTSQARDGVIGDVSTDAAVHIYAPCSSVNANRQIPFDADLLNGNITIRIALKSASELWSVIQSGAEAAPVAPISAAMKQLDIARWYLRQYTLVDTTASKKDEVGPNGQFMQPYFWYHSHTFSQGEGAINLGTAAYPGGVSPVQSVTLNGFTNGSLQGMTLYVQREDESYSGAVASPSGIKAPCYMDCRELVEVEIVYNGRCVYKGEFDKIAKLLDLSLNHTDSTYDQLNVVRNGTNVEVGAGVTLNRASVYRIQISQFSEVFRDYLQTGAELSANTMQLRFRIKDDELEAATATVPRKYTCNVEYLYQASVTVQKGVGRFDFQNPLPAPSLSNLPAIAP